MLCTKYQPFCSSLNVFMSAKWALMKGQILPRHTADPRTHRPQPNFLLMHRRGLQRITKWFIRAKNHGHIDIWMQKNCKSSVLGMVVRFFCINRLRPKQNGPHFADNIFKYIFLNENVWISIKISMNFFPEVRINNIAALVQIRAWRRPGDKPLSEYEYIIWNSEYVFSLRNVFQIIDSQRTLVWNVYNFVFSSDLYVSTNNSTCKGLRQEDITLYFSTWPLQIYGLS